MTCAWVVKWWLLWGGISGRIIRANYNQTGEGHFVPRTAVGCRFGLPRSGWSAGLVQPIGDDVVGNGIRYPTAPRPTAADAATKLSRGLLAGLVEVEHTEPTGRRACKRGRIPPTWRDSCMHFRHALRDPVGI